MKPGPKKLYPCRVELRVSEELLAKLDDWRSNVWFHDHWMNRNEAIRLAIERLVEPDI